MVKLKICGLTNWLDYRLACELGADYTGFIFYEKSARFVDPDLARNLVKRGKYSALKVGVFVNEPLSKVKSIYEFVGLDIVQLQGDEDPLFCEALSLPYWKAIRVRDAFALEEMKRFSCETILLDSFSSHSYGGTGNEVDRNILKKAMDSEKKIIVAGGVSAFNIEEIFKMGPFGVDVCSFLEEYPGKKSAEKMKIFFQKINQLRGLK
jgi:phosphoribosylanthranilate isomerase